MFTLAATLLAVGIADLASASETKTYTYDALGRLIVVENSGTVNDNETRSFCYDAVGNRLQFDSNDTAAQALCVEQGSVVPVAACVERGRGEAESYTVAVDAAGDVVTVSLVPAGRQPVQAPSFADVEVVAASVSAVNAGMGTSEGVQ